mmetsp:Transcript_25897/g.56258  ORF Transcript_25897/g.56258 Transcript_25897/m.56258 type:complete len:234 (-) Transcript_25897:208-909(-)|eukprot:CAMPEP_0206476176 /NCGR_PEP_ID=MMETSP0324_2-20121206/34556_1 /ASSEMBLY_ACC=CAM_ASM_000836 /TAXON_ID=2866 /ORGANISM="Crypthecodinium cohnii, Strain Seligo" /LENGTH=233 /DNA_ID=CAMNT_0053951749 /DNA_START=306 /DNA_END=1007 /DNA_ORIENTATION=+
MSMAMRSTMRARTTSSTWYGQAPPETVDVDFSRTTGGIPWTRSQSAGDLVRLCRGPNRRPFDSSVHMEELVSPNSAIERLSDKPTSIADPLQRVTYQRFASRKESVSSVGEDPFSKTSSRYGAKQGRALECWQLGDTCRIANHILPKKHRNISLSGEVYQGKWKCDWSNVDNIKMYRNRYPAERLREEGQPLPPHPIGMSQEEIIRNRGFDKSHGSQRMAMGLMSVGALVVVP